MEYLTGEPKRQWINGLYCKLKIKLSAECDRIGNRIPYIAENGVYADYGAERPDWWTNGFWPGILWLMYEAEGEEKYLKAASGAEDTLAENLKLFKGNDHDYGFRYYLSCCAHYKLTGDEEAKRRGLFAAQMLAGRYNPEGRFIRAWDAPERVTWLIIDCMMNLPLLFWASEQTKDPRFAGIARAHAETTLKVLIRPDGSSGHVAVLDQQTWELVERPGGQGYGEESSWSRGQAWAVYGFALAYKYTKEERFLDAAKQAAHYFLANVCGTDFVPLVDFRAPREPVMYDTTAGMAAACGLLTIAGMVPEYQKDMYVSGAVKLIKAVEAEHCNFDPDYDSILQNGTVMYTRQIHVPIIYGDFFLLEAVQRLCGYDFEIW